MFSDSQLRPVVERQIAVPDNWYVNCTPGGCFAHISEEVRHAEVEHGPSAAVVVLVVGTNDMSSHYTIEKARNHFQGLLNSVKTKFPIAKVRK